MRIATTHPIQYYISANTSWPGSPAQRWPVIINYCGSSKDWLSEHNAMRAALDAAGMQYILVTPLIFSNGGVYDTGMGGATWQGTFATEYASYTASVIYNAPYLTQTSDATTFDQDGVQAIIQDLGFFFLADLSRIYLAPFSGGGDLAWMQVLSNPELFKGGAFAATNYTGLGVTNSVPANRFPISTDPRRVALPIEVFLGSADAQFSTLQTQNTNGISAANGAGYAGVVSSIDIIAGQNHNPLLTWTLPYIASLP